MPTPPVALVTGGNRGIGREVCRQLAARGYNVLLGARDLGKGRVAAREIDAASGAVEPVRLDVTSDADVDAVASLVRERFGRIDALVNVAGIDYDTDQHVLTADLDRVRHVWETNTLGPWRLAQAFAPLLKASGHGRLVNVTSGAGQFGSLGAGTPAYSHSKAALNALTVMLAEALKGDGVLVNAVGPGWVRTDMGGPNASRSIEEGADTVVWAATLPDDGPTGGLYRDRQRQPW